MPVLSQTHFRLRTIALYSHFISDDYFHSLRRDTKWQKHKYNILNKLMSHFKGTIYIWRTFENTSTCSTLLQFIYGYQIKLLSVLPLQDIIARTWEMNTWIFQLFVVFVLDVVNLKYSYLKEALSIISPRLFVVKFFNRFFTSSFCWSCRKLSPVLHHCLFVFFA